MLYFLEKAGKIAAALGGALPPDPRVVIPTQFTCYFKYCANFSASLKLRPKAYLGDSYWASLAKLAPLAQTSSYTTDCDLCFTQLRYDLALV